MSAIHLATLGPHLTSLFLELERLCLTSIPLFPYPPFSSSLCELSLFGVTPPAGPPLLSPLTFPSLRHLGVRYISRPGNAHDSLREIAAQLDSLSLYIGDNDIVQQVPSLNMSDKILFDVESDDLHLVQTSPEAANWKVRHIRYSPYQPGRGDLVLSHEMRAFAITLQHSLTLKDVKSIYLSNEWEVGVLRSDLIFRGIEYLEEVCKLKGINLIRDEKRDPGSNLISSLFAQSRS